MYRILSIIYNKLVLVNSQLTLSKHYFELGRRLCIGIYYMRIWSQRAREQVAMRPQSKWVLTVVGLWGLLRETGIKEKDHLVGLLIHLHRDR